MARNVDGNSERSAEAADRASEAALAPSTTWQLRRVRVTRGAAGSDTARRSRSYWRRFPRRNPGDWITIRVKWRGGGQDWCLVDARGEVNAIPGHRCLFDVVMDVNNAR